MDKTALGDRMKDYERREAGRRFMPRLPILARIDGKGFSKWTQGLPRPYDQRLSDLMVSTTTHLVDKTQARVGYTQSDEITLVLWSPNEKSQLFFDRRIQKITSVLASMTTAFFNAQIPGAIPERAGRPAMFDCRVWAVPDREEAVNCLLWRELDATKNSISMAARDHYSHKALQGKNGGEMQELLHQKGVNWNDYPSFFKRGTYVGRRIVRRRFSVDELADLPPKHLAHTNPELEVERTEIRRLELPPLRRVPNRVEVIFDGAEPAEA
jgi:tRNA(His) guanylyltransferase